MRAPGGSRRRALVPSKISDYSQRMDDVAVGQVRSFNRTLTERIGVLDDHYLGRDRPLGEARVLWEIGREGAEVRALRGRLALDSGYLSRMLRSLERQRLVRVRVSPDDRRVRHVALTGAGPERAGGARPAVRRPRRGHPRAPHGIAARAARDGDGAGGTAAPGVHGPLRGRGPGRPRRAVVPRAVLRRAPGAVRGRFRSRAFALPHHRRFYAAGGRVRRRAPARPSGGLRCVEVPRRRRRT